MANQPRYPGDDPSTPIDPAYTGPVYEYDTTSACTTDPPGGPRADTNCTRATAACAAPGHGPGPLTRIWRRLTQNETPLPGTTWENIGVTCYSDVTPGSKPRITMAMIMNAFHTTPWAKPQITTQPVGNRTLVGLDTYYQVTWTTDGYQPDEIDTTTLLGSTVAIRPRLDHFTYVFGDGTTLGPTTETGGVYPTGTITHPYLTPGTYHPRVDTTFAADFRINGGPWAPIPDTITIPGPPTTLTVTTATNHLVTH